MLAPRELGRTHPARALVDEDAARERVALECTPLEGRRQRVAGHDGVAEDWRVEVDGADRGPAQVEAVRRGMAADQLGQDRAARPRDLDAGVHRAGFRPSAIAPAPQGRPLDRQVVEHRDRLGADADDVVDVHRYAVDTDGLGPGRPARRARARTDAVGRHRDAERVADAQDTGVVRRSARPSATGAELDLTQHADERVDAPVAPGWCRRRRRRTRRSSTAMLGTSGGQRHSLARTTAPSARGRRRRAAASGRARPDGSAWPTSVDERRAGADRQRRPVPRGRPRRARARP